MEANNIKGALNGLCNRSACLAPGANWYNHSTREHYCEACAHLLNEHNFKDAMEMFGHNLCTLVEDDIPLLPSMQESKSLPYVNPYKHLDKPHTKQPKECKGRHLYVEHVTDNKGAVLEVSYICKCGKVLGES